MTFLIIGTIAGIMLALRFKIVVLGPAILLATAVITMSGILSGHKAGAIALTVFGTAALLQIGYISGCILHALAQSSGSRQHRGVLRSFLNVVLDDQPQTSSEPTSANRNPG